MHLRPKSTNAGLTHSTTGLKITRRPYPHVAPAGDNGGDSAVASGLPAFPISSLPSPEGGLEAQRPQGGRRRGTSGGCSHARRAGGGALQLIAGSPPPASGRPDPPFPWPDPSTLLVDLGPRCGCARGRHWSSLLLASLGGCGGGACEAGRSGGSMWRGDDGSRGHADPGADGATGWPWLAAALKTTLAVVVVVLRRRRDGIWGLRA